MKRASASLLVVPSWLLGETLEDASHYFFYVRLSSHTIPRRHQAVPISRRIRSLRERLYPCADHFAAWLGLVT
jgi:hypothetical protein